MDEQRSQDFIRAQIARYEQEGWVVVERHPFVIQKGRVTKTIIPHPKEFPCEKTL